jgi:hypothetical protein
MKTKRKPTELEIGIIQKLINLTDLILPQDWENQLLVIPMNDGGMGSLKLLLNTDETDVRQFGRQASEIIFIDKDGVAVLVTLYLDKNEELFELGVWKTDFSPIISFPNI